VVTGKVRGVDIGFDPGIWFRLVVVVVVPDVVVLDVTWVIDPVGPNRVWPFSLQLIAKLEEPD
jgi:hypothetical protein